MKEVTIEKLYEDYIHTLQMCGSYLLSQDDEIIGYNIFEEFDIGVITFFHESVLKKLFEAGFISDDKMKKSLELREMALNLQDKGEWDIEIFKKSIDWRKLLKLVDEIKSIN